MFSYGLPGQEGSQLLTLRGCRTTCCPYTLYDALEILSTVFLRCQPHPLLQGEESTRAQHRVIALHQASSRKHLAVTTQHPPCQASQSPLSRPYRSMGHLTSRRECCPFLGYETIWCIWEAETRGWLQVQAQPGLDREF